MTLTALPTEWRDDALVKIYAVHRLIAEIKGYAEVEAATSADDMKRRIDDTIQAIRISGGSASGRG